MLVISLTMGALILSGTIPESALSVLGIVAAVIRFIARRPDCWQRWTGKKAVSCCRCKSDFTNPTCRDTCCDVSRCAVSLSGRRYWGALRRYGSRTFSLNEKGTEKISKMKLVKIDKYTFEGVFYIDLCEVKWIQDIDV